MEIRYDPAKDRVNFAKHGLSFADFQGFDAAPSVKIDDRYDYGETRYRTFGRINDAAHCVVFTIAGGGPRLISWRRAHEKEMIHHE